MNGYQKVRLNSNCQLPGIYSVERQTIYNFPSSTVWRCSKAFACIRKRDCRQLTLHRAKSPVSIDSFLVCPKAIAHAASWKWSTISPHRLNVESMFASLLLLVVFQLWPFYWTALSCQAIVGTLQVFKAIHSTILSWFPNLPCVWFFDSRSTMNEGKRNQRQESTPAATDV